MMAAFSKINEIKLCITENHKFKPIPLYLAKINFTIQLCEIVISDK